MKRLFALFVFSLLLLGCTTSPATPSVTPLPSATPSPTPTPSPEPVEAAAIESVSQMVPVASSMTKLTGVQTKSPDQYVLTTNGDFEGSAGLRMISEWDFESDSFEQRLAKFATAPHFEKTMSWQSSGDAAAKQFDIKWYGWADTRDFGTLTATLSKKGSSSLCIAESAQKPECVSPTKEQVDALFTALSGNALDQGIQALLPGTDLKTYLSVEKTGKATYIQRPCQSFTLKLNEAGLQLLTALGQKSLADLTGKICVDDEYGFPLYMDLKSAWASVSEKVARFTTARVGILEYPYSFRGLCTKPGAPCDNKQYTNPHIGFASYPESLNEYLDASVVATCQTAGRVSLKAGGCVRYPAGDAFVLKYVDAKWISLVQYDQNLKAQGEYLIRPSGDVKKDQYFLGTNIDGQVMALATLSLSSTEAELEFIAYDSKFQGQNEEVAQNQRKYSRGFKDPQNPTAEEAYYALFSPGSKIEEGLQKFGNSDFVDLKNGVKVAFYWFYPEPYSEVSMAGRLDSKVTAYVFSPGTPLKDSKGYPLTLGKVVDLGSFSKNYPSTATLELVKADLTRDGSIQVRATSSALSAKTALKTCVRQVTIDSPQTLAKTADCKNHFVNPDDDVSFAGNAAVSIDVPQGAQKVSVDIGYNAGALHCNKVQVNGQAVLDQTGQVYCGQVNGASACPGVTSGAFLKTVSIEDGTKTIRIDHGFKVFYVGKGTKLGDYPGSRLQGTLQYHATQCATGDFEVRNTATSTPAPLSSPVPVASPTVTPTAKPSATPATISPPVPTSTPTASANLKSCEIPVYFQLLRKLTQDLRCYNDDAKSGEYVSNPYYAPTVSATYSLPQGAVNAKYWAITYHVNDGCEQVSVNGVKVVDKSCTLPWKGGNCPMSHDGTGELMPNGITFTGNSLTVTGSYADFYGGKGDNGGMTVQGKLSYQAPACPTSNEPVVVVG